MQRAVVWLWLSVLIVGRQVVNHLAHRGGVLGRCSAAAANHVYKMLAKVGLHLRNHVFGRVVVSAKLVWQTGIRVTADVARCTFCHLAQIRNHSVGSKTAVQTNA